MDGLIAVLVLLAWFVGLILVIALVIYSLNKLRHLFDVLTGAPYWALFGLILICAFPALHTASQLKQANTQYQALIADRVPVDLAAFENIAEGYLRAPSSEFYVIETITRPRLSDVDIVLIDHEGQAAALVSDVPKGWRQWETEHLDENGVLTFDVRRSERANVDIAMLRDAMLNKGVHLSDDIFILQVTESEKGESFKAGLRKKRWQMFFTFCLFVLPISLLVLRIRRDRWPKQLES